MDATTEPLATDPTCHCLTDAHETYAATFDVAPGAGGGWVAWGVALARLLANLVARPTHCVVITQEPDQRYAQMMVGHGRAVVEVSSNHYLFGDFALSAAECAHLELLGFEPPGDPDRAEETGEHGPWNWRLELDPADGRQLADLVVHVLVAVVGFSDRHPISVQVFGADHPCRPCSWGA